MDPEKIAPPPDYVAELLWHLKERRAGRESNSEYHGHSTRIGVLALQDGWGDVLSEAIRREKR